MSWRGFAVAALALLAAALPALPTQGQAAATGGLSIQGITLDHVPQVADGPPDHAQVQVTVRNDGSAPSGTYLLAYRWQPDGQAAGWMNGDPPSSTDAATQGPLAPGDSRVHQANWTLQAGQVGPGTLLVTLAEGAHNQTRGLRVFLAEHRLSIALEDQNLTLAPDETGFLRVGLRNDGNVAEPVALSVPNATAGGRSRLSFELVPSSLVLPAGAQASATLFVGYPFLGDPSGLAANATVQADWAGGVLQTGPQNVSATDCCVTVGQLWTAEAPPAASLPAGATSTIAVAVHNAGPSGTDDTYQMDADAPDGWVAAVQPTRLGLRPGESGQFLVRLTAPMASPGSAPPLALQLRSGHVPQSPTNLSVPLRVRGPSPAVVAVSPQRDPLYAGDPLNVSLAVTNRGDRDQGAWVIHLAATVPGQPPWQADFEVPPLPAGGNSTLAVAIPLPTSQATAVAVAASWGNGPSGAASFDASLAVRHARVVLEPPLPQSGMPGEAVSYQGESAFRVANVGDHAEALQVQAWAANGSVQVLAADRFLLQAGDSLSVPLLHRLPRPSGASPSDSLTLEVRLQDRPDLAWNASVPTRVADRQAPDLRAPPPPSPWALGAPMGLRAEAQDDGQVAAVDALVSDPDGTLEDIALAPTATAWGGLWAPHAAGNYTLTFRAIDRAGNAANTTRSAIRVLPIAPPVLHPKMPTQPLGAADFFLVQVVDNRSVADLRAWVDGDPSNVTLLPLASGWAAIGPGTMGGLHDGPNTVVVEAVDDAGAAANQTLRFDVALPSSGQSPGHPSPNTKPHASPGLQGVGVEALALLVVALRRKR